MQQSSDEIISISVLLVKVIDQFPNKKSILTLYSNYRPVPLRSILVVLFLNQMSFFARDAERCSLFKRA